LFKWQLKSKTGKAVCISAQMNRFDLSVRGLRKLCRLKINLPAVEKPESLIFSCELTSSDGKQRITNQWDLWLFPNDPARIGEVSATVDLQNAKLSKRYAQFAEEGDINDPAKLLITDNINKKVIEHLERGNDVLLAYRIDENRDKKAQREKYYLPSTWERFKGVIWDRGHNCGGFLREHKIVEDFPHDGLVDWQFYHLIDDSDKIDLDDFPIKVEPIIEGVDKAIRDRYDVGRFDLPEFQYEYTMRKFAYLFELKVGKGRLIVAGMNFKPVEQNEPATCWMFENIINYMQSSEFEPKASISVEKFSDYLLEKGKSKRIKERMMTQYWQIDAEPLESKQYWKESEEWLRQDD